MRAHGIEQEEGESNRGAAPQVAARHVIESTAQMPVQRALLLLIDETDLGNSPGLGRVISDPESTSPGAFAAEDDDDDIGKKTRIHTSVQDFRY